VSNQELKNKFEIYNLVEKYFGLTEESERLFKYRLFQNPHIAPEYAKILKDSKDLRARFDIDGSKFREVNDEGWKLFREYFYDFTSYTRMTYESFMENKIRFPGENQDFRLKKALEKFYIGMQLKKVNIDVFIPHFLNIFSVLWVKGEREKNSWSYYVSKADEIRFITYREYNNFLGSTFPRENSTNQYIQNVGGSFISNECKISMSDEYIELVKNHIKKCMEEIGAIRLPTKQKLQLVLSLNFADWFLCSAAENGWSSCMSLESDYEGSFWAGLPGTIGDKNRALIYITDGKKKNYGGIETDRFISRSWAFLVRTGKKEKSKTKLHVSVEYPVDAGIEEMAEKLFGIEIIESEKFKSRYYFEFLYHDCRGEEVSASVYNDTVTPKVATKNKAKHNIGKYGYYVIGGNGVIRHKRVKGKMCMKSDDSEYFNFGGGLSALMDRDGIITNYFSPYHDDYYEDEYDEDDDNYYDEEAI